MICCPKKDTSKNLISSNLWKGDFVVLISLYLRKIFKKVESKHYFVFHALSNEPIFVRFNFFCHRASYIVPLRGKESGGNFTSKGMWNETLEVFLFILFIVFIFSFYLLKVQWIICCYMLWLHKKVNKNTQRAKSFRPKLKPNYELRLRGLQLFYQQTNWTGGTVNCFLFRYFLCECGLWCELCFLSSSKNTELNLRAVIDLRSLSVSLFLFSSWTGGCELCVNELRGSSCYLFVFLLWLDLWLLCAVSFRQNRSGRNASPAK